MDRIIIAQEVWEKLQCEFNLRNDYMGDGAPCFTVVGCREGYFGMVLASIIGSDQAFPIAERVQRGRLGRHAVIYFPEIELENFGDKAKIIPLFSRNGKKESNDRS